MVNTLSTQCIQNNGRLDKKLCMQWKQPPWEEHKSKWYTYRREAQILMHTHSVWGSSRSIPFADRRVCCLSDNTEKSASNKTDFFMNLNNIYNIGSNYSTCKITHGDVQHTIHLSAHGASLISEFAWAGQGMWSLALLSDSHMVSLHKPLTAQ